MTPLSVLYAFADADADMDEDTDADMDAHGRRHSLMINPIRHFQPVTNIRKRGIKSQIKRCV